MAATSGVPEFNTLKECLEFLEWLHSDRQGRVMQGLMAHRLVKFLDKRYKSVSPDDIESALSRFLEHVSTFYTKLCKSPKHSYIGKRSARDTLNYLLQCIPKFFSAIYFLRYHVDGGFTALGGGGWAKQPVGLISLWPSRATYIDKYLTETSHSHQYGVIAGGFDRGELKPGFRGVYSEGHLMVNDLKNILEKYSDKEDIQNFFIDVFSTTVLSTSGFDTSNVANALRLVRDFCRIFEKVKNQDDFEKHLYLKDRCMDWEELKEHCKKLIGPLEDIFKKDRFSFTGYAREHDKLYNEKFAKKMASWFRTNLGAVQKSVQRIQPFTSKNLKVDRRSIRSGSLPPSEAPKVAAYFTNNFFCYGFTFYANKYNANNAPYEDLKRHWDSAIRQLNQTDEGLNKLVKILNGKSCPAVEPQHDEEAKEEPEDVELVDEGFGLVPKNVEPPPAKVPEAPKEVVPEKKVAAPKKPEVPPNQGKKAEGAQNQGKKSEGAQNQGKKSEGAQNRGKKAEDNQNQENGQSETTTEASPVANSVTAPSSGVQGEAGTPGPPDAHQPGSQSLRSGGRDTITSVDQPPGIISGGAGESGGTSSGSTVSAKKDPMMCENGLRAIFVGGIKSCQSQEERDRAQRFQEKLDKMKDKVNKQRKDEENAERAYQDEQRKIHEVMEIQKRRIQLQQNNLASLHGYPITHAPILVTNHKPINIHKGHKLKSKTASIHRPKTVKSGNNAPGSVMNLTHTGLTGSFKDNTQVSHFINITPPLPHVPEFTGQPIPNIQLENAWSPPLPMQKPTAQPTEPIESHPPIPDLHNNLLRTQQLSVGGSRIPTTQLPGIPNFEINLPVETNGHTIPDPKRYSPTPPLPISKIPKMSAVATTTKIPHEVIPVFLSDINRLASEASGQHILDPNVGRRMPPLPTSKPTVQHDHTSIKSPITAALGNHDMDSLTNITISEVKSTPKTLAQVSPLYAMATGYPLRPPKLTNPPHDTTIDVPNIIVTPIHNIKTKLHQPPLPPIDSPYPRRPQPQINIEIEKRSKPEYIFDKEMRNDEHIPLDFIDPAYPNDIHLGQLPMPLLPDMEMEFDRHITSDPPVTITLNTMADLNTCRNPWYVPTNSTSPASTAPSPPPASYHLPPPRTVREMLCWVVGLNQYGLISMITEHINSILVESNEYVFELSAAIDVTGDLKKLDASHVTAKLTEACHYSSSVLYKIKHNNDLKAFSAFDFKSVYSKFRYFSDPAGLLCQLRDYCYACCHQLQFLKVQCNRDKLRSGWKDYHYGSVITSSKSPLQSFLTDDWDCPFDTHLFDPCNPCLKSRIRMGFKKNDLSNDSQTGSTISAILSPTCGGEDPLLTLSSYLNCLTRRTPRTTGELVSYFHNFGNELHEYASKSLSPLGTAITKSHLDCPDWDRLGDSDLGAVRGIRGTESIDSISNDNHDKYHPRTLSTLVGCGSDPANCHPHCSPITYRAYALYSQSFAHTYVSWTVYLPDKLWESLEKLFYELKKHDYAKCTSLHSCPDALPLLYTHGFTPPEVGSQPKFTCSDVIAKLQEIVNGKPIANLITAMDNFLYGIREPFIFTLVTLWSTAFLIFATTMLYRLDVLCIRSHLIRTKASHRIDVKALLTEVRKMLSLYKDVDYFDEDPIG